MRLFISLLVITAIISVIYYYCRKLTMLRRSLESSKRDLDELFARRDELAKSLSSGLAAEEEKHELVLMQENINFLTEFHNIKAKEYNEFINSRQASMASNILLLAKGLSGWLRKK